jgi:hypothetical protein
MGIHNTRETFWEKVEKTPTCWLWRGNKNKFGYGSISFLNKRHGAHRLAYEFIRGPIPEDMVLDHLCRNPSCVNPDHLEIVTQRENILRGTAPAAIQAKKTHCKFGHEFNKENTRFKNNAGHRVCRKCHAIKTNEKYHLNKKPCGIKNSLKTHCKRGHCLIPDNLYPRNDGRRECLTCRNFRRKNHGLVDPATT